MDVVFRCLRGLDAGPVVLDRRLSRMDLGLDEVFCRGGNELDCRLYDGAVDEAVCARRFSHSHPKQVLGKGGCVGALRRVMFGGSYFLVDFVSDVPSKAVFTNLG